VWTAKIVKQMKIFRNLNCSDIKQCAQKQAHFIATGACITIHIHAVRPAERAKANVVLDSRSIRARKPLFYANLAAFAASNKLFARSSPFMDGTERDLYTREGRSPLLSVGTICRSRRRKYDQIFAANKAYGER